MGNFKIEQFYDAVAAWLNGQGVLNVGRVTDISQDVEYGSCGEETCDYEYAVIVIHYRDFDNHMRTYEFVGDMGEMLRAL